MADATRCALCGNDNGCGMAAGSSDCWCFSLPVPPALVARVPAELQNVACVCQGCVRSYLHEEGDRERRGREAAEGHQAHRPHEV